MAKENNFGGNLTPRARQVFELARKEADRFNHDYLGTEHLLLGLLALGEGVAVEALKALGISLDTLRLEVEKTVGAGGPTKTEGALPLTPRLKKIIVLAATEARSMNYNFIGTEHLLLAILREGGSAAARVLTNLKVDPEKLRSQIVQALDPNYLPGPEDPENPDSSRADAEGSGIPPAGGVNGDYPALNAFGRDLTEHFIDRIGKRLIVARIQEKASCTHGVLQIPLAASRTAEIEISTFGEIKAMDLCPRATAYLFVAVQGSAAYGTF